MNSKSCRPSAGLFVSISRPWYVNAVPIGSALPTLACQNARPKARTKITDIFAFFIFLSFSNLSLYRQGTAKFTLRFLSRHFLSCTSWFHNQQTPAGKNRIHVIKRMFFSTLTLFNLLFVRFIMNHLQPPYIRIRWRGLMFQFPQRSNFAAGHFLS